MGFMKNLNINRSLRSWKVMMCITYFIISICYLSLEVPSGCEGLVIKMDCVKKVH
jgi:hypothetical protein